MACFWAYSSKTSDPGGIELEITESAVMVDPEHCIRLIAALRDHGYFVSIDDFGVGHSCLAYLQRLRVSGLKIDQEFVKTHQCRELPLRSRSSKLCLNAGGESNKRNIVFVLLLPEFLLNFAQHG